MLTKGYSPKTIGTKAGAKAIETKVGTSFSPLAVETKAGTKLSHGLGTRHLNSPSSPATLCPGLDYNIRDRIWTVRDQGKWFLD